MPNRGDFEVFSSQIVVSSPPLSVSLRESFKETVVIWTLPHMNELGWTR